MAPVPPRSQPGRLPRPALTQLPCRLRGDGHSHGSVRRAAPSSSRRGSAPLARPTARPRTGAAPAVLRAHRHGHGETLLRGGAAGDEASPLMNITGRERRSGRGRSPARRCQRGPAVPHRDPPPATAPQPALHNNPAPRRAVARAPRAARPMGSEGGVVAMATAARPPLAERLLGGAPRARPMRRRRSGWGPPFCGAALRGGGRAAPALRILPCGSCSLSGASGRAAGVFLEPRSSRSAVSL